ncbi:MAG: Hsp20/alpha crystallin family protein [Thermoplasmata archaeon]
MLEDFRTEFENMFWRSPAETTTMKRSPLTDLADRGDHYEVVAEIPGIPKDRIDIQVSENNLEITAEAEERKGEEGKEYLSREISYRGYRRKIALPEEVIPDKAKATNVDGILKIELPKRTPKRSTKPRKLEIK